MRRRTSPTDLYVIEHQASPCRATVLRGRASPAGRSLDRRIQKTRALLHRALGDLIRKKSYDQITVGDILLRANVGRSTFYAHFRDKDELLLSAMNELLRTAEVAARSPSAGPDERLVRFSLPLLEHIRRHRDLGEARIGERGRAVLHEHLRRVLAERIGRDIARDWKTSRRTRPPIAPELVAQFVASSFVLVLHWWIDNRALTSAAEADEAFRALVTPALAAVRS